MKHAGSSGACGLKLPTEEEVEVAEILLDLPELIEQSELLSGYSFTWGKKKKRSALDPLPGGGGGGGSGGEKCKTPSSSKIILKTKTKDELMEECIRLEQEREILMKKLNEMKPLHQELSNEILELKAKIQKINYTRNTEGYHIWDNSMKTVDQQITMFAPATSQQINHTEPRVQMHEETYDFMGLSQSLDQSKYVVMDSDLRVKAAAAAARKRRMLKMKQKKNSLSAIKPSRSS